MPFRKLRFATVSIKRYIQAYPRVKLDWKPKELSDVSSDSQLISK